MTRGERARTVLAWIGHPAVLLAVAVLLVNDHLLKRRWPGPVTGKLSDLAWMLVAPPVLALVLTIAATAVAQATRRVPSARTVEADRIALAAILGTGVGFTVTKASAGGAAVVSGLWSAGGVPTRIVGDPTDLAVLPLLGVSWLLWTRARSRPVGARGIRMAKVLLAVPLAVVAMVATSSTVSSYPTSLGTWQGHVVQMDSPVPLTSTDGGVSWHPLFPSVRGVPSRLPAGFAVTLQSHACVPAEPWHCFRVGLGALRVDETTDYGAHWSTAWAIAPGRMFFLQRIRPNYLIGDDPFPSRSETVVVAAGLAGYRVIVANDAGGWLVRAPDGRWTWADAAAHPQVGFARGVFKEEAVAWTVVWLTALVGTTAAVLRRRTVELRRTGPFGPAAVARSLFRLLGPRLAWGGGWITTVLLIDGIARQPGFAGKAGILLVSLFAVPVLHISSFSWDRGPIGLRTGCCLALVAIGTGALVLLPYLGWTVGLPADYRAASGWAVAALAGGVTLSGSLGWRMRLAEDDRPPGVGSRPPSADQCD